MIVATLGLKGGAGKTTLAVNLAAELTARGHRVLLVDGDPQQSAKTWADVGLEAGREVPTVVAMGSNLHHPGQLDRLGASFDSIVIDSPPRLDGVQRAALMKADVALIPCSPSPVDVWALAASVELVREAQIVRPALKAFVVMNRTANTRMAKATRAAIAEQAGLPMLDAGLTQRVQHTEAFAAGQGVTTYAPQDAAADEVRALLDEIIHHHLNEEQHVESPSDDRAA
jgi:chromosome partitioning protein